jgi:hypothetical protein
MHARQPEYSTDIHHDQLDGDQLNSDQPNTNENLEQEAQNKDEELAALSSAFAHISQRIST